MANRSAPNCLQRQLIYLISLEALIEQRLEELLSKVSDHAETAAMLSEFIDLPRNQRQALNARLNFLTDKTLEMEEPSAISFAGNVNEWDEYPISMALQSTYTLFNQAIISYSVMHSLATRFLDSPYRADEGTAYHLTRQHTENYVQAIQRISRLLHDVVLWELDQEGLACECICPSCGAGICLCSMAGRAFLSEVWQEAGPILKDEGVYVQLPKPNSAAEKAGLQKGDFILKAKDQEIDSYSVLQEAIKNTKPGEEVLLTVRRKSAETEEVVTLHL